MQNKFLIYLKKNILYLIFTLMWMENKQETLKNYFDMHNQNLTR